MAGLESNSPLKIESSYGYLRTLLMGLLLSLTLQIVQSDRLSSPQHERSIWDDDTIGISWPDIGMDPILSAKDSEAPSLGMAQVPKFKS